MSNPHKFDPNRRGLCKFTTRNGMCHLPKDAPVHKRYEEKIASDEELEKEMCLACQRTVTSWIRICIPGIFEITGNITPAGAKACPHCGTMRLELP